MGAGERFKRSLGLVGGGNSNSVAPARVRDAAGKVLEVGDEVIVITPKTVMRVAAISRILDPGAPPNAMLVTLVTRLALAAPCDQPIEDLYFTRHAAEIPGDGFFKGQPEAPPADDPPPADTPKVTLD